MLPPCRKEDKIPFMPHRGPVWEERVSGRVAQRIRARGYEPRSRGFKSLLARSSSGATASRREVPFILWGTSGNWLFENPGKINSA